MIFGFDWPRERSLKMVDGRRRTPEHGYTISSACMLSLAKKKRRRKTTTIFAVKESREIFTTMRGKINKI